MDDCTKCDTAKNELCAGCLAIPAASAGYSLLANGERVVSTDEFLSDDCTYWIIAGDLIEGAIYSSSRDNPCRRKL